jgi:hypothetical protein|tara:strand:+ start:152 stop:904 length:753 start_codon:yes stop_codon:yes gene_type:complete
MNILKILRHKSIALFVSFTVLFYSCEKYEVMTPKKFSFEQFQKFKKNNIDFLPINIENFEKKGNQKTVNPNIIVSNLNSIVNQINQHYNSDISIPDNILLGIHNKTSENEVKTFLKQENLMTDNEINLYEGFVINSKNQGFNTAMDSFEKEIIDKNLGISEFEKYNNMANTLQIMNDQDPKMFEMDNQNYSLKSSMNVWWCLLSYVLWVLSLVAWFAACAGPQAIFFCFAASANIIRASYSVITDCAGHM